MQNFLEQTCQGIIRALRRFAQERDGGLGIAFVILIPALLLLGGIGLDYSKLNTQKRQVQAQADLAALAAVRLMDQDQALASRVGIGMINLNSGCQGATATQACAGDAAPKILFGIWEDGVWRETRSGEKPNAVQAQASAQFRPLLLGLFMNADDMQVRRSSVATPRAELPPMAAYTLRNQLLRVNTGGSALLSAVLEPLGISLTADVLGDGGLASARVKLTDLLMLASGGVGLGVLSFNDVLDLPVKVSDLLGFSLKGGGNKYLEGFKLDNRVFGKGIDGTVTMRQILDIDPTLARVRVGDILPDLTIGAGDLLSVVAGLAAKPDQRVGLSTGIKLIHPSLLDAQLSLGLIRAAVSTVRPATTVTLPPQLELKQTELTLSADLLNNRLLGLLMLRLNLGVAGAEATLTSVNCHARPGTNEPLATFAVMTRPLTIDLQLGLFTNQETLDANRARHQDSNTLLVQPVPQQVSFTRDELDSGKAEKTFRTPLQITQSLGNALQRLVEGVIIGTADPDDKRKCSITNPLQCLVNAAALLLGTLLNGLTTVLNTLLPIDRIVDRLLTELGISVAAAELRLDGVICDGADTGGGAIAW